MAKRETVFLTGDMLLGRTVLRTKILEPTQTGNKPFINVNGCVSCHFAQHLDWALATLIIMEFTRGVPLTLF